MSLLQAGLDISRGIGDAQIHQFLRQGNYNANLGMNHFFSTATSYQLIATALSKVNTVIQHIEFTKIPSIPSPIIFSAPLCISLTLTYIKKSIDFTRYPNLHTIITTLDNCILPNVILVTNLVASVALIVFGSPVYGGCNFIFLLLHLLDEQGLINTDFIQRNRFLVSALFLCNISSLLTVPGLYNTYLLINMIIDIAYNMITYINKKNITNNNVISTITLQEYESKFAILPLSQYRLSNYHLLKEPISNIPVENLENQFDHYTSLLKGYLEQDLSTDNSRISQIFQDDEQWKNAYNGNPVDYLNDGVNKLIMDIQLTKTKELKNKFLSLIRYLSQLSKKEGIHLLAQLAQIGHYCPDRQYKDIGMLYDTYIDKIEKRSLSNQLLAILHDERSQILDQGIAFIHNVGLFTNLLAILDKQNPLSNENRRIAKNYLKQLEPFDEKQLDEVTENMLNVLKNEHKRTRICKIVEDIFIKFVASVMPPMGDIHFANQMKNYFSSYCYVHHKSIDILTKDRRSKLEKWIYTFVYRNIINLIQEKFSQQYNPKIVLQRIVNIINNESTINSLEIQQWFKEQYLASYPEVIPAAAITWVQKNVYDQKTFKIQPSYVRFFLANQGVLELIENGQKTTLPF